MVVEYLKPKNKRWEMATQYAADCSWRAGKNLAKQMREGTFSDWI